MRLPLAPPNHFRLNSVINAIAGNLPVSIEKAYADWVTTGQHQVQLIQEELDELVQAIKADDRRGIRDGLADSLVTLDGLFYRLELGYPSLALIHDEASKLFATGPLAHFLNAAQQSLSALKDYFDSAPGSVTAVEARHTWLQSIDHDSVRLLLVLYVVASMLSVDIPRDQLAVYESNLSKFDTDYETACKGLQKYWDQGVKVTLVLSYGDIQGAGHQLRYYVIKVLEGGLDRNGKMQPAGKFLKSIHFKEPQFAEEVMNG